MNFMGPAKFQQHMSISGKLLKETSAAFWREDNSERRCNFQALQQQQQNVQNLQGKNPDHGARSGA